MKMSVHHPEARYSEVFLDDEKLRDCIEADEENGKAVVYARDLNGRFIIDQRCNSVMLKTLYGRVEIRKKVIHES